MNSVHVHQHMPAHEPSIGTVDGGANVYSPSLSVSTQGALDATQSESLSCDMRMQ